MAEANRSPVYPRARAPFRGLVSAANTNEDGTGTLVTLYTAPSDCAFAVVRTVRANARVTTTAGRLKFFVDASATLRKVLDLPVSAVTLAADDNWTTADLPNANGLTGDIPVEITLLPGEILKIGTHIAEAFDVSGEVEIF